MRDAEVLEHEFLRLHHVLDRRPGVAGAMGGAGGGIDRLRSGRSKGRAGQVYADDEVLLQIDALPYPTAVPPTRPLIPPSPYFPAACALADSA